MHTCRSTCACAPGPLLALHTASAPRIRALHPARSAALPTVPSGTRRLALCCSCLGRRRLGSRPALLLQGVELVRVLDLDLGPAEEAVQRALLGLGLGGLQPLDVALHAILAEGAALDEELGQPLDIRLPEFDLHRAGVDGLAVPEELASDVISEVLRDLVGTEKLDDLLNAAVLSQELDGGGRAHTFQRVAIITAAEDAEVNELVHRDVELLQGAFKVHLQNLLLLRLCGHQVPNENLGAKCQTVRILGGSRIDLAIPAQRCARRLRLTRRINDRQAHEPQQRLRLLVLLPGHLDGPLGAL
mmetsp:Transcript_55070/g.144842  ORF Transcript_55070/g.144842 Transcript_55070/m.144842 type:complete len:302 (+) Transcript_55070:82-987(+)